MAELGCTAVGIETERDVNKDPSFFFSNAGAAVQEKEEKKNSIIALALQTRTAWMWLSRTALLFFLHRVHARDTSTHRYFGNALTDFTF